ncbi:phage protein NinX family protein [Xenorhabdus sp. SGI246]|uniref:phage protein NinX family protein n=1 Tax=Xenorhabdus sp. SGI246 TaxID=3158263 RepID=UPI00349F7587
MKIKTSELTGKALDWAVARVTACDVKINENKNISATFNGCRYAACWEPSSDWSICGQLIEKYIDDFTHMAFRGDHWVANCRAVRVGDFSIFKTQTGDTPQIAICRAVVAAQLGDEVEIPDELVEE